MRKLINRFLNAYFKKSEILSEIIVLKSKILNNEFEIERINLEIKMTSQDNIAGLNKLGEIRTFIFNCNKDCNNRLRDLQDKLYDYE